MVKATKVENPSKTLHIYTRVSTQAQVNEGTSLTTQHQLGKKKAKQLKFEPCHWDEGGKSSHHEDINGRTMNRDFGMNMFEITLSYKCST